MKNDVCNNVQRKVHVSRAIVWRDDMIFRFNINNGRNGCTFIIRSSIARRPKTF
jgi:hypothetical protein